MRVIFTLSFFVIALLDVPRAQAGEPTNISELSKLFAGGDSIVRAANFEKFENLVPLSSRLATLSKLLESADSSREGHLLQTQIVAYLAVRKQTDWKDDPELHALVMERARGGDVGTRLTVFELIVDSYAGDTKKALVLTFLGDPEEVLRGRAITTINKLDDGQKILESYVRKHQSDKDYKDSVAMAKRWIERKKQREK